MAYILNYSTEIISANIAPRGTFQVLRTPHGNLRLPHIVGETVEYSSTQDFTVTVRLCEIRRINSILKFKILSFLLFLPTKLVSI